MKAINDSNFLLTNALAEELFHEVAAPLPLIDYHNHLNPIHLADNQRFENISRLWVTTDPYKHRAMRICGIPEEKITGKADDREIFINWCKTVPYTVGNPLYHWSVLELKQFFGIDDIPDGNNAVKIWEECNKQLDERELGAMDILKGMNVELLCTSDDFCDDLSSHMKASASEHNIRVLPSLRADTALSFDQPTFKEWLGRLEKITTVSVKDMDSYCEALIRRIDAFGDAGCVFSDHSLEGGFQFRTVTKDIASSLFSNVLKGNLPDGAGNLALKSWLLQFLGQEYGRRKWIMQLHVGAHRSTSSRLKRLVGTYGGYAALGKACDIESLCKFLDVLELGGNLPDTILYTLNPADNAAFATITGSFAEDGTPGKIQFGPAWWYNDHLEGMRQQLITLSSYGLISQFIGMTTDSRSVLSFSRHEYFRRILCNLIGNWTEEGVLPNDKDLLSELVKNIAFNNIKQKIVKRLNLNLFIP